MIKLNIVTHDWESRPVLAISRYGHGCAVLEDSLYISGGYTGEVDKRRANWQIKALAETLLTNEKCLFWTSPYPGNGPSLWF